MSKKKGKKFPVNSAAAARGEAVAVPGEAGRGEETRKQPVLWLLSFTFIILGYILLYKVDPGGRNAWAILSPALLLAGYLLVIPAIILTYRS